ncbi:MAG TPA: hypothetical protein VMV86_06045 [Methanosarcinales archaeon]|mgnify:FL=1|nr:hypothetical protein [Methanosarcinales archaeon]|tara:strand:+ start:227 stop:469 length:243 start_codon:yes stop_codon:yes gene_type:complete
MDRRQKIVLAAEQALIELDKVIRQKIDLVELDPEKAKTAAQAKWVAIEDSLKIIEKIEQLTESKSSKETKTFLGVENRIK